MQVLEKAIEQAVLRWTKKHGIVQTKMNMLGRRSWPDRCFWIPKGKPVLIEFKKPGGKPTELQADTIAELKELGYAVYVCDNAQKAIEILIGHYRKATGRTLEAPR